MGIGELAFAHTESREIEAQHANAAHREPLRNPLGCEVVLAASKTVREQRESRRFAERQVDEGRQFLAFGIAKFEPLGAHDWPSRFAGVNECLRVRTRSTLRQACRRLKLLLKNRAIGPAERDLAAKNGGIASQSAAQFGKALARRLQIRG